MEIPFEDLTLSVMHLVVIEKPFARMSCRPGRPGRGKSDASSLVE
jgi:hypothetical protein